MRFFTILNSPYKNKLSPRGAKHFAPRGLNLSLSTDRKTIVIRQAVSLRALLRNISKDRASVCTPQKRCVKR